MCSGSHRSELISLKGIMAKKVRLIDIRHPVWSDNQSDWMTWRLTYEGGQAFLDTFLKKFSRREGRTDFLQRKELTYNPSHTSTCLNMYRDSLMSKAHEIVRTGDPIYKDICSKNVDQSNNSMNSFMGLQFIPWLMAQQRRFIMVDAPPVVEGTTRDQDNGRPFIWAVNAENVLAWKFEDGKMTKVLIQEVAEVEDVDTGLAVDTDIQYRYMELVPAGSDPIQVSKDYEFVPPSSTEPCVMVRLIDKIGKDKCEPYSLNLPRLPLVMGELVESMLKNVAPIQIALMNLNSTDMVFLFKGNFPLYVENRDKAQRVIPPRATKKTVRDMEKVDMEDREADEDIINRERKEVGTMAGVSFGKDLVAPSFIGPPISNCQLSMAKQGEMKQEIRVLLDLSLVSMAQKALTQSGESKAMDRVGLDKGLSYVGTVCEQVERDVAEIIHLFLQSTTKFEVKYPTEYSLKTKAERLEECTSLQAGKAMVRSKTWQNEVSKDQVRTVLQSRVDASVIETICNEIDENEWFDESLERSQILGADILNKLVSTKTASLMRGYPEGEAESVQEEDQAAAEALSGGPTQPPELDEDGNPIPPIEGEDPPTPPEGIGSEE